MLEKQVWAAFRTRTGKLAATYFGIIMSMTLAFSGILYTVSSSQFDRPLPHRFDDRAASITSNNQIGSLLQERASEARYELVIALLALNLGMALFALWFSFFLARLTMAPIEEAMQEQERFVSDAAHELRTPLTALRAANEVALRKGDITPKEARALARHNVDEAAKLHDLSSSLLGLVRTSDLAVEVSPVDVQQAVSDAMSSVVAHAQQKSIAVEDATATATVYTNETQLVQLLRILLDNAVKYSPKNSTVTISGKLHGEDYILAVADMGIGIADADLPHIFDRFYRADSSRTKTEADGYGIGLSIAKAISDKYAMSITVKSKLGKGTTFSLKLPVRSEKGEK